MRIIVSLLLLGTLLLTSISGMRKPDTKLSGKDPELEKKIRRFAPTVLTANTARLSPGQVWSGNDELHKKLAADRSIVGRQRLHYFLINDGPWSRLDSNAPFIEGAPHEKPPHANFYPDDITKDEFNSWLAGLPDAEKEKATGYFYTIRRDANGKLMSVPYSEEYREFLEPAAGLLREAAALTTNQTLKDFLTKRADAFASNDYYASDIAWMDLKAPIDVTIGPYETYEDELFGYKAGFEAYVTLTDAVESAKLEKFGQHLQELENNLPMEARYRNPKLGALAPMRVVNEVFGSGEGNDGVQTAAFNLPNDERVVKEKGSARIMLKNVQDAKFNKVLLPITRVVLSPAQQRAVAFDSFFTHILMHELMHGLGPHNITVGGQATTVRLQLKDLYSSIEEAKADVTGLWALQYLLDKGVIEKQMQRTLYTTYLASMFRSVRFGLTESHARGVAMQFNYFTDEGAIKFDATTGKFSIDNGKIKEAVRKLTQELLTIEAEGSYEKAKVMLDKYSLIRPEMKGALDRLKEVPVDIEPIFPLAK